MQPAGPGVEILEREAPRSRLPGRAAAAAALVLALIGGAAAAVGAVRAPAERSALEACGSRAVAVVERAERRIASLTSYIAGSLVGAPPQLNDSLVALISQEAAGRRPSVDAALAGCRRVEVWPTNRSHLETRAAYVAFLEAERDRLRGIAADGRAFFTGYDEVRVLADEAETLRSR